MRKLTFLLTFLLFVAFQASAQMQISGKVTNAETGEPIPGASIVVKSQTTIGTTTDMDGNYTLSGIPSDAETLVFSFVGMQEKEIAINGRSTINVELAPSVQEMDEVIVTAYGTSKKSSFTGSADNIDNEEIENRNISTLSKGLEGSVPGLQVANSSGQPGEDAQIRIRGFGSINASSDPLYVVDGVPFDGDLNSINPADIESMSVLKDATATSLYGARGANGVIMITTKSGEGETEIRYNYKEGVSARAYPEYNQVNSEEFVELQWEAYRNAIYNNPSIDVTLQEANVAAAQGAPDLGIESNIMNNLGNYNPFDVPMDQVIDPSTGKVNPDANLQWGNNWQDEMFRIGNRSEHNVSVSGAKEGTEYYMSLGYLNEDGIVKNSGFERFTARINVDSEIKEWLKGGFKLSGATADQAVFLAEGTYTVNPFYYTRFMGPIYPVYERDANGNIVRDDQGNKVLDYGAHGDDPDRPRQRPYAANSNILGQTSLDNRSNKTDNVGSRFYIQIDFLEDFNFETNFSTDYRNVHGIEHQNALHGDAASFNGRTEKYHSRNISMNLNQLLTYDKDFGKHSVNVLAGHEAYKKNYNYLTATRTGFPFGGLEELATATNMEASNSYRDEYRIESYLSRVKYNYDSRYYFSGSYRRDGSSRFHEDARWGNFWSIGGSWRVSQEAFLAGFDWIQDFKFKASYGEQGNDRLLDNFNNPIYYGYQSFYEIRNNYSYSGFTIASLANKSLQWEVSSNFNTGIEFRLFDRLYGEVNYFEKGSDELLFDYPLPQSTGLAFVKDNVGAMINKGIETRVGYDPIRTENLRWNVEVSVTSFENEITELPQEEIVTGSKKYKKGKSIYEYWIREYAGVDPQTGDALYYTDVLNEEGEPTGNREITSDYTKADRYYVGSAIPDLTGSFSSSVSYKGINFSFLLTYGVGGKMLDYAYMRMMHAGDYGTHMHENIKDRWQEPGDVTGVPRLENGYDFANQRSDRFLIDKSYLNIKNVRLGYTLPKSLLSNLGIGVKSLRIFAQGDNLYLFSKLQGMNPQESFSGVTDYQYTPSKTISFGANVKF